MFISIILIYILNVYKEISDVTVPIMLAIQSERKSTPRNFKTIGISIRCLIKLHTLSK